MGNKQILVWVGESGSPASNPGFVCTPGFRVSGQHRSFLHSNGAHQRVGFTIAVNNTGSSRVGSIMVGGQAFSVIQPPVTSKVTPAPSSIVNLLPSSVSSGVGISTTENIVQSFITDANGYPLESLSVLLLNNQAAASSVSVQLWTHALNRPGTMLESFAARSVSGGAPVTHTYPSAGGTTLAANTRYWVVVKVESGAILWGQTSSAASNPGPGTVPDGRRVSFDDGANWTGVAGTDIFDVIEAVGTKTPPGLGDTFTPNGNWTLTEGSASGGQNPRPPYQLSLSETDGIVSGNGVGLVACVTVSGADHVNGVDESVIFVVFGANCTPRGTTDTYTGQLSGDTISGTYVSRDSDPATPDITGNFTMQRSVPPTVPADYNTWTAAFAGHDLNDPNADLNNNGQSNLEDWLWGIDPVDVSPARPVRIPHEANGAFNCTRRDPLLSGHSFEVWYSVDLETWTKDAGATWSLGAPGANNVETVTVSPSASLLNQPGVFFRMRAVRGE